MMMSAASCSCAVHMHACHRWGITRDELSTCDSVRIGACVVAMFVAMAVQVCMYVACYNGIAYSTCRLTRVDIEGMQKNTRIVQMAVDNHLAVLATVALYLILCLEVCTIHSLSAPLIFPTSYPTNLG